MYTTNYNQQLVAFMYLLVRDHLPIGVALKMANEIKLTPENFVFENQNLLKLAEDLLSRLES